MSSNKDSNSTITAKPLLNIGVGETDQGEDSSSNPVFLYNGVWAYNSEDDNQLYIFDQTKNEWIKSTVILSENSSSNPSDPPPPPLSSEKKINNRNNNNNNNNSSNNKTGKKYNRDRKNKRKDDGEKLEDKNKDAEFEVVDLVVSNVPVDPRLLAAGDLFQYFRKAGFIQENDYGAPLIKFFMNEEGGRTGQAVISFARKESVALAIQLYDETEIVPGYTIRLAVAEGTQIQSKGAGSGSGDSMGKKKKKSGDKRTDMKRQVDYGWEESESRVVVLKNLFDPVESWTNINFFDELKEDIEMGCQRCGEIQTINIFERNPEGVAIVKFKDYESAEQCVALMEGRFFAQRQLKAELYDGFTDYHVEETEEEKELRIKVWEKYLEEQDLKEQQAEQEQNERERQSLEENDSD